MYPHLTDEKGCAVDVWFDGCDLPEYRPVAHTCSGELRHQIVVARLTSSTACQFVEAEFPHPHGLTVGHLLVGERRRRIVLRVDCSGPAIEVERVLLD